MGWSRVESGGVGEWSRGGVRRGEEVERSGAEWSGVHLLRECESLAHIPGLRFFGVSDVRGE